MKTKIEGLVALGAITGEVGEYVLEQNPKVIDFEDLEGDVGGVIDSYKAIIRQDGAKYELLCECGAKEPCAHLVALALQADNLKAIAKGKVKSVDTGGKEGEKVEEPPEDVIEGYINRVTKKFTTAQIDETWVSFKNKPEEFNGLEQGDQIKVKVDRKEGRKTIYVMDILELKKPEKADEGEEEAPIKEAEILLPETEIQRQETALVPIQITDEELVPKNVIALKEMGDRITLINDFMKKYLNKDEDYGTIPGTKKPTLYKPGAEKIYRLYGLVPKWVEKRATDDFDKPFFSREYECQLVNLKHNIVVARGLGSCNSYENRYYDSNNKRYKQDAYFVHNTIVKMAKKRATVDAVLSLPGVSVKFTQDMEDTEVKK